MGFLGYLFGIASTAGGAHSSVRSSGIGWFVGG